MNGFLTRLFLLLGVVGAVSIALPAGADPIYPVQVGPTGRYLVDQTGTPFLIAGESPQAMIGDLSLVEAEAFFANRRAHGFNTVWINLLCNGYTGCSNNGSTVDFLAPFTVEGDLATPNEAYFARADQILQLAAQYGFLVILDPIETGGWLDILHANGTTKAFAYGQYVGQRYTNFDNIVWMHGNDFQSWPTASDDALVLSVAQGILDRDTRHIHTVLLNYPVSGSLDDASWSPSIQLNASYTYFPTYYQVLTDYNRQNFRPVFLGEAGYEFENLYQGATGLPKTLRSQEYWALLSGAAGQMYGNKYTWQFIPGWQNQLDTPGAVQVGYLMALFAPRRWYDLVPDQTHTIVTGGLGTFSGDEGGRDYVTAARTLDGTLAMAYIPPDGAGTITVAMAQLSGLVTARWYDPAAGTFLNIPGSPFANSGSLNFTTPGNNADGDRDWVLVLEVLGGTDTTAPSVAFVTPTSSPTYLTNANPLVVAGTAADNVGVTQVTWLNSAGGSGTASGTTSWIIPSVTLQLGVNVIVVTARDAANNFASATLTITYDPIAPDTTITSSPPALSNSFHPTFEFTSTEANSTFECSLDGSAFAPCTSPKTYIVDVSGGHNFQVRAIDPTGNVDPTPASYSWTVDMTAPDTTITASPAALTGSTSASFSFTSTEAGSTFQCSLDGLTFIACTSPQSYSLLSGGGHTFQVRAIDPAGNVDQTPASFTWTIDVTNPTVAISSPTSTGVYSTTSNVLSMAGTAADNVGLSQVTWANDRGGSGTAIGTTSWTISGIILQLGVNVITVTAQDTTGHVAPAILSVTLSTSFVFTDAPLVPQNTVVKAVHVTQLRTAIDAVRGAHQLQPFPWTDAVITPGVTQVAGIHLVQLRAALNAAYQAASRALPTYTNASVGTGSLIKAVDLTELQSAVNALQ